VEDELERLVAALELGDVLQAVEKGRCGSRGEVDRHGGFAIAGAGIGHHRPERDPEVSRFRVGLVPDAVAVRVEKDVPDEVPLFFADVGDGKRKIPPELLLQPQAEFPRARGGEVGVDALLVVIGVVEPVVFGEELERVLRPDETVQILVVPVEAVPAVGETVWRACG